MLLQAVLLATLAPTCPEPEAWLAGDRSSKTERRDTRQRLEATWKALGADRDAIAVLSAIALRESSYDTCAVHRLGINENGSGPMGLANLHRKKFGGEWLPQIPEVSGVVTWRIALNAKLRYRVKDWANFGEIYAGRVRLIERDEHRMNRFCLRLSRRGVDCRKPMSKLGDGLSRKPSPADVTFVMELRGEDV